MTNSRRGGKTAKFQSKRRKLTLKRMSSIRRYINNRKDDWVAKTTTRLVEDYDLIALEALNPRQMTRKPKPKQDTNHKGRYLRNGSAAKAGLNRSILNNRWTDIQNKLEYKTRLAGTQLILVNPAYTSQTCNRCGHVAKENRESQAVSNASTAVSKTMRTSTRPRTSSTARYTQPAWTMPRAWRDTHPVKPVFHGKVPLKRQPLPHMWEDSPNRGLSHMRQESPGFSRGEEVNPLFEKD